MQLQRAMAGPLNTLPIVFLTGTGDVQTGAEAIEQGAVDFLTKPIDCVRLFAAVKQAFQRDELGTSDKTVKLHRARVMSKKRARSVPALVQLGARVGLEIQPYQSIGSTAISWRQPDLRSSRGGSNAKRSEHRPQPGRLEGTLSFPPSEWRRLIFESIRLLA
jgi:hypothetical protein